MSHIDEIEMQHLKIHWEHMKLHFELMMKYVENVLKLLTFYVLLSAGIISYYLAHLEVYNLKYSLLFPVVIGVISIVFFSYGKRKSKLAIESIHVVTSLLKLTNPPDYTVLPKLLVFAIVTYTMTIICSTYLFIFGV